MDLNVLVVGFAFCWMFDDLYYSCDTICFINRVRP